MQWRKERLGDAAIFYRNANFSDRVRRFLDTPKNVDARAKLQTWVRKVREAYQYDRLCLHDAQVVERLSYPEGIEPTDSLFLRHASEVLRTRQIVFQDFYRDEHDQRVYLNLLVPILDAEKGERVIGILAMRIDPQIYLYPLISRWPTPARTGETVLIRREGTDALFLNELKFQKNTALNLRSSLSNEQIPVVKAALGQEGIVEGKDYRNVPVVADVRAIPGSPWFLVTCMDLSELYAPLKERLWATVFLIGTLLIGAGVSVGLVWRHQRARFYRKQYEAGLERKALASHFDYLVKHANDIIFLLDTGGAILEANDQACRSYGYTREEFVRLTIPDLHPPELRQMFGAQMLEVEARNGMVFESRHVRKDGTDFPVEVSSRMIDIEGRSFYQDIIRDITERKRAEQALQHYSERLAVINRLDRVITSSLEINEVYEAFVQEMSRLIAFDRTSIVQLDGSAQRWQIVHQWTRGVPALLAGEWRPVAGSYVEWLVSQREPLVERQIGEKGNWPESELLRREGISSRVALPLMIKSQVIGAVSLASYEPAAYSEKDLGMLRSLADQMAIAVNNSQLYHQIRIYATEMEQLVAERTSNLEAANKELEAFSYSISHDLRAPLRAIDGFSRIVLEEYAKRLDAEGNRLLNIICANTQKMDQLITDLLDLSRVTRNEMKLSRIDMTKLANSIYHEIALPEVQKQFSFSVAPLPDAYGDPTLVRQVWSNLISNAIKFTTPKDVRKIEIGGHTEEGMNMYLVRDSDVGFNPAYTHKLFGVFQRLHKAEEFEGTGVGLAIVQRIIHRHGGKVWAEGKVGEGATFWFSLPSRE